MHAVAFALKRAFQSTLRITRPLFESLGLTAARFDMLQAVWQRGGQILQRTLREILGVSAATVSVMLKSLEELGFVSRSIPPADRRQRLVSLTLSGRERITVADHQVVETGIVHLALESVVSRDLWHDESWRFTSLAGLEDRLDDVRFGFRDLGSLSYPWREDD